MKKEHVTYQCPVCGTICSKDYIVKDDRCPNCNEKVKTIKK